MGTAISTEELAEFEELHGCAEITDWDGHVLIRGDMDEDLLDMGRDDDLVENLFAYEDIGDLLV